MPEAALSGGPGQWRGLGWGLISHPITPLTQDATAVGWRSQRRARSQVRRDRDRRLNRARCARSASAYRASTRWLISSKYGQLPGGCGAQLMRSLLVSNTIKQFTLVFLGVQPVN
jgi:hypothetical protein